MEALNSTSEAASQEIVDPLYEQLFEFTKSKIQIDLVIGTWNAEMLEAEARRKERYVEVDIENLRQIGDIAEDETFCPDRVIDGNIKREKADIMAFLNAGQRLAVFDCTSKPNVDTRQLELEFTQGLTFKGWYREFERVADGAELHGFDYLEVVFDTSKPLHVGFEHVGYDRLFYNRKVEDIQDSEYLIRKYEITTSKLEEFKGKKFSETQIDEILKNFTELKRNDTVDIYKVYFKYQGIVYYGYYCKQTGVNDWLKAPEPLRLGIYEQDVNNQWISSDIPLYPIFTNIYCDDEQFAIVDKKGRGFLDMPQQEANTAIITAFVNSAIRSSFVYACPDNDDSDSAQIIQLDQQLSPDGIYNKPLKFFSKPAPDVTMLNAIQLLDNKSSIQAGKVGFAANNRKDSRKTAKELVIADQQEQKITSTGLAGFSEFVRGVFEFAWIIIKSQALQDKIKLLLIPEQVDPNIQGAPRFVNNKQLINEVYDIRPAGDTDVIEAQNLMNKMQQDWPVIQATALKDQFLMDYIQLCYPKKALVYLPILAQSNQMQQLQQKVQEASAIIPALNTALQHAMQPLPEIELTDKNITKLSKKDQDGLVQVMQQASIWSQP